MINLVWKVFSPIMAWGKTQVLEAVTCVWLFLPDDTMSYQLHYELHWESRFKRENDLETCKDLTLNVLLKV